MHCSWCSYDNFYRSFRGNWEFMCKIYETAFKDKKKKKLNENLYNNIFSKYVDENIVFMKLHLHKYSPNAPFVD